MEEENNLSREIRQEIVEIAEEVCERNQAILMEKMEHLQNELDTLKKKTNSLENGHENMFKTINEFSRISLENNDRNFDFDDKNKNDQKNSALKRTCSNVSTNTVVLSRSEVPIRSNIVDITDYCSPSSTATSNNPSPRYTVKNTNISTETPSTSNINAGQEKPNNELNNCGEFNSNLEQKLFEYENELKSVAEKCYSLEETFTTTINKLEQQIEELTQKNIIMNTISDNFTSTITEMSKNLWTLEKKLKILEERDRIFENLIPTPASMKYERKDDNSILFSWENTIPILSCIEGYNLCLNDTPLGRIVAKNKRALISDVDPTQSYKITLQSISKFAGLCSMKSDLNVPCLDDEEKENLSDSATLSEKFPSRTENSSN